MRERIQNIYRSGSLHSDLHLQRPHTSVVGDEFEEDMQFSVSSRSQEAASRTDGIAENAENVIICPEDLDSTEEDASHSQAVSDEEGSRYHRSKYQVHKRVDRFARTEYVRNHSDSDDEDAMHHSRRKDEDGPPPKKRRMFQSRDSSPRVMHTTHESEGLKDPLKSKREYWAKKAGSGKTPDQPVKDIHV